MKTKPKNLTATAAQIRANRENAKKSTGPRTAEGQAVSSRNGLTHGLSANTHILPGEDPEDFLALLKDLFDRFRPVGQGEEKLVLRIAAGQWRLDRAFPIEAGICREESRRLSLLDRNRQESYRYSIERGQTNTRPPVSHEKADLLARAFTADGASADALARLARYESAIEHSIDRSLRQLKAFQAARIAAAAQLQPAETKSQPSPAPPATNPPTPDYEPNPINQAPTPNPAQPTLDNADDNLDQTRIPNSQPPQGAAALP